MLQLKAVMNTIMGSSILTMAVLIMAVYGIYSSYVRWMK